MSGKEIVLLNEEGKSWNLNTTYTKATIKTLAGPGWRRFCAENGMNQGHYYTFKLYIKRNFVNANGLEGLSEIILKNEWGGRWRVGLTYYESLNHTYLRPGWKTFCQVNGIKAGDSFMFKVVGTGDKPVLLLCTSNRGKTPLESPEDSDDVNSLSSDTSSGDDSSESQESEEECLGDEGSSHERFEMEKEKNRCRASSSYSEDRFVKLTLTPRALKTYKLVKLMHNSASRVSLGLLFFFIYCLKSNLCVESSAGFHMGEWHQQAREDNSVR
ncbi:hypothetical protein Bca101_066833 [Brassica carinata]